MTHYPGSLIKEIGAHESERRSKANAAERAFAPKPSTTAKIKNPAELGGVL